MRLLSALALLLLLSPLISAVSLSEFLKPYMLPGESYRAEPFTQLNRSFVLINVLGAPYFLAERQGDGFLLISSEHDIYAILWERQLSEIDLDGTRNASLQYLREFNRTRQPNENECRRLTGTDRLPCTDKESCIVACRSVPNCQTALSYNLDSILGILGWLNTTGRLDSQLQVAADAHYSIGDNFESSYVDGAAAEVDGLKSLGINITTNIIFYCGPGGMCYCPTPGFNFTAIDSSLGLLSSLSGKLAALHELDTVAGQMAHKSAERAGIRDEGMRYALVLQETRDQLLGLRTKLDESSAFVHDAQLTKSFDEAQSISISLQGAVGQKDYNAADSFSRSLYSKLGPLEVRAESNKASYEELVDLHLNATEIMEQLAGLGMVQDTAVKYDTLAARLNGLSIDPPVEYSSLKSLRTELTGIGKEANSLYISVAGDRVNSSLASANARYSNLTKLASDYRQNLSLSDITAALRSADTLLKAGDVQGADFMITSANSQMDTLFPALIARINQIAAAQDAIETARQALDAGDEAQTRFIRPDLSVAREKYADSRKLLYTDPESSKALAEEAELLAQEALSNAYFLDQFAIMVAVLAGIISAVLALYWLYKREEA